MDHPRTVGHLYMRISKIVAHGGFHARLGRLVWLGLVTAVICARLLAGLGTENLYCSTTEPEVSTSIYSTIANKKCYVMTHNYLLQTSEVLYTIL